MSAKKWAALIISHLQHTDGQKAAHLTDEPLTHQNISSGSSYMPPRLQEIPHVARTLLSPPSYCFMFLFCAGFNKHNFCSKCCCCLTSGLGDRVASAVAISAMNGDARNLGDIKPRITEESNDKSKIWKLTEVNDPSQCRSMKLPENMRVTKISRLIYTNSGNAILALASNAVHLLWKWQRSERNSNGKATASVAPQLWKPSSGILMTNGVTDSNPEDAVSCFALSKNDSYVMSTSGGKISLFNMMTFKVKSKLKGHSKRITGLAFSHVLNVLLSSGVDAQLCVWSSDGWEKQKTRYLQVPAGRTPTAQSDTRVQYHQDQLHFLVVHESQLAIYI